MADATRPPGGHILLIGLRASGKTTVGAALARRLGLACVDLDDRTLEELRRANPTRELLTIAAAWGALGEPAFREAETRALAAALREPTCVMALGGGTPLAPGADALLRAASRAGATIVYLRADPATLRARLARGAAGGVDAARPSLTGAGLLEEVEHVFAVRDPVYWALARHSVDATIAPGPCVDAVVEALRRP